MKQTTSIITSFIKTRYLRRWQTRDSFLQWQEKQIVRHLDDVRNTSTFYRKLWGCLPSTEWRRFPAIDKKIMMDNFDELNTVGIHKQEAFEIALQAERTRDFTAAVGKVTIGLSSGTSGNRGLFLVSEKERYDWAGTVLAKALPGSLFQRHKIAFFLRANSQLYQSVRSRHIQFAYYDLLEPVGHHILRLNEFQPTIIVGPPSLLRMLAEASNSRMLHIQPTKIISVAEVLDPLDQAVIQSAFNQTVHQIYQCTEGFLAATCRYGTLHLNEDIVCIEKEVVDHAQKKFVPIITDFNRKSQPIVRYRLNDLLTELDGCRCGSVFTPIQSIEGRCDDVFYLQAENGNDMIPVFPDYISRALLAASPELCEYKVIQTNTDRIEMMLDIEPALRPAAINKINRAMHELCRKLGCRLPALSFCDYRAPVAGVKLRRVERRIRIDEQTI